MEALAPEESDKKYSFKLLETVILCFLPTLFLQVLSWFSLRWTPHHQKLHRQGRSRVRVNAVSCLDLKHALLERIKILHSNKFAEMCKCCYCCFAGCFPPISSVTCKSDLLTLHIHTDSRRANRHILSNLEHGINGVRDVWFSLVTTVIRLWVAQIPWCNCKLTTRLEVEKSKLVTTLSYFSKRSLWLQWFLIASSTETDRIYLHERGWRIEEHKHWAAFLHLKCAKFQQQGCTGFTHRLYDLENKIEETRFSFSLKRTLNSVSIFPQPTSPCTFRWKYWSEKAKILH